MDIESLEHEDRDECKKQLKNDHKVEIEKKVLQCFCAEGVKENFATKVSV